MVKIICDSDGHSWSRKGLLYSTKRHAGGAIVMYDITDYGSFTGVATWKKEIDRNCRKKNIPYILVGNKVDIRGSHIEGKQTAKVLKMDDSLKTSAKTGEGIDLAIKTIIALVSKSVAAHQPINQENITISDYQSIKQVRHKARSFSVARTDHLLRKKASSQVHRS